MSTSMKTMQSKPCNNLNIFSLFLFFFFLAVVNAQPPQTICNHSPYARFCRSILPKNKSATVHDCGRNSIYHSISTTNGFRSLVGRYLDPEFDFPERTRNALQDCYTLAALNEDFLADTIESIRYTTTLPSWEAEDMHNLLSAALTNHETCIQGLQEVGAAGTSVWNALLSPLMDGRMSYSVSLTFFLRGWGWRHRFSWPWFRFYNHGVWNRPGSVVPAGVNASEVVVVNPNGRGDFLNISDAVNAAPNNTAAGNGYYVILIVEGVYEEYVSIPKQKKYIMMIGAGINKTIITGNRSVSGDNVTTFNSATFAVVAEGFVAQKITFRNTAGAVNHQAVALRSGADLSSFYQCSFEGYQDTLYTHSMRQFYKDCDIYGTVDFIFGNAAVVLQDCNIYPRLPMQGQFNTITAQGRTDINQNTGTSIQGCIIAPAPDLASDNGTTQTYLGRPWKTYSRTVVIQSELGSFINPAGWAEWSGNTSLDTLYYAEYNNTGPGSDTANRVTWPGFHLIDSGGAANFTVSQFIQGTSWLNGTGVPFYSGLL